MRVFFVFCLVCSAVAVAAPPTTDADVVIPLTSASEITRSVSLVVTVSPSVSPSASPSPSPTPKTTPARTPLNAAVKPATPKPTPTPVPTPKPTAKPTPTPTPTPNASRSATYSREQVKAGIRSAWGGDDDEAIRVADCESGLNPRAGSSSGHYGLWQMRMETWHSYGGSGDPRDASPAAQTAAAWRLFQQRGWSPWAGCAR
jgi:hypothetical protein